ncbi:endolytic transglycosylase MltG [Mesobacillus maritimus]|uniref:endolytic transglycosylase MltG n=1 Tax=Mesobacillus maritimus TaxID=1643336 RepID=UPI00203E7F4E|nr:endolytic transglycosylase MltG [Mesobacillus maritimus]MCM3669971.1 endolytic transglycosylase MltG [Mesobacillus maritimus]
MAKEKKNKNNSKKLEIGEKKQYIAEKMTEQQNEAKVVRKIVSVLAIALVLLVAIIVVGGYFYISNALKPVDEENKEELVVEIPIGSTSTGIGQILEENGIIRDATVFKYYVKFRNESGFMAGEYTLSPSMNLKTVIETVKTGSMMQEVVMKITIPEGKQLTQIAEIISEKTNKDYKDVFAQLNDEDFIQELMKKYPEILTDKILDSQIKYPLEGYLFPATYPFYEENPPLEEIVTAMLDKTKSVVMDYLPLAEDKGLSVHELMTMSSLIEEEATAKVDRDKISSVFYNRMETGMKLQTDPTVLYAHGEHKDRVYYKDLEIDSPYNTYQHYGLPPGPIANAGIMSIEAAVAPADIDDLYFLATPEGEVLFSKTLEEHNRRKAEHITNQ